MLGPFGANSPGKPGDDDGFETGIAVKSRPKTKKPAMYKVLMLNDDYTPMLHVHQRGVGVCGVFTHELAETKATQVMDLARQNDHPLQCTIERDGDD